MKFSTSISIDAPAMKVWQILTNAEAYPDWDPGMIRLEGEIAPGNKITAYTKISPERAFPVTVTDGSLVNARITGAGFLPTNHNLASGLSFLISGKILL